MSRLEIYAVDRKGLPQGYEEVSNSAACAYTIWSTLSKELLGQEFSLSAASKDGNYPLWQAVNDGSIELEWRLCLAFTLDAVWVHRQNIPRLCGALDKFWKKYGANKGISPTIPGAILALTNIWNDHDLLGAAFNITSVNSNPWVKIYADGKRHRRISVYDKKDRNGSKIRELMEVVAAHNALWVCEYLDPHDGQWKWHDSIAPSKNIAIIENELKYCGDMKVRCVPYVRKES